MTETAAKLHFVPVHPLNFPYTQIHEEAESPSPRWPFIKRTVSLFTDVQGFLAVQVCFKSDDDPGNLDTLRCYQARVAPAGKFKNPLGAYPDRLELADMCEAQFAAKLAQFYGDPEGKPEARPAHWEAM
jgi:hypothetical protein